MLVEIRQQGFNPWDELSSYENSGHINPGSFGACATFVGSMRDFNQGDKVNEMKLEHYPGMTERLLTEKADKILREKELLDILIIHRVGRVVPNDPVVLVAAWSAHRAAAFDGCREMMEYLKSSATFWKKERLDMSGEPTFRWVENVSG